MQQHERSIFVSSLQLWGGACLLLGGGRVVEDEIQLAGLHGQQPPQHRLGQALPAVLGDALPHPLVVVVILGALAQDLGGAFLRLAAQQRLQPRRSAALRASTSLALTSHTSHLLNGSYPGE